MCEKPKPQREVLKDAMPGEKRNNSSDPKIPDL